MAKVTRIISLATGDESRITMSIWKKMSGLLDYNPSSLSGCIDVIVAEDEEGRLESTPFHIRVGKFKLFRSFEKIITLRINGLQSEHGMKISGKGIGYWEIETGKDDFLAEENLFHDDEEDSKEELARRGPESFAQKNESLRSSELAQNSSSQDERNPPLLKEPPKGTSLHHEAEGQDEENQIELSICGHLVNERTPRASVAKAFAQHRVDFSRFDRDPSRILEDDRLMIKVGKSIYDRQIGLPQIVALLAYNNELSQGTIARLRRNQAEAEEKDRSFGDSRGKKHYRKSLKPTHAILASFKLREGINQLEYHFVGNMESTVVFKSRIFYYRYRAQRRVIISDIDGTITRSDVLGHVMPFIYQDWSHKDICHLFTNIANRGYIIIYLTARNIGLFSKTLEYLRSIKQNGFTLPEGPMLTSPDSLFDSLKREIIIKNPEVFKIQVLRDLKHVFGDKNNYNPIYAGFGNKDTDAIAYRAVSIPKRRIFIINPNGDIFQMKSEETYSYGHLARNLEETFPAYDSDLAPKEDEQIIRLSQIEIPDLKDPYFLQ